MKNKMLYLLSFVVTIFLVIMYDSDFLLVLLVFELLLCVGLFLQVQWLRRGLEVTLKAANSVVQKGEPLFVDIYVKNRSWMPVNCYRISMCYENAFSYKTKKEVFEGVIQGKSEIKMTYQVTSEYCGQLHFFLKQVRVYDYLQLFSGRKKCSSSITTTILPDIHEVNIEISQRTKHFIVDGDEYEQHRSGDDPSEIYQVRAFRNGDTMQRVHWKLSAKADEMMTKEFSHPKGSKVLVLLDFYHESSMGFGEDKMDCFLEIASSLTYSMMSADVTHYVAWYDEINSRIVRKHVQDEDSVYELIETLFTAMVYMQDYELERGYYAEYSGERFSSVLVLDTYLKLSLNGEEIEDFSNQDARAGMEGFICVV